MLSELIISISLMELPFPEVSSGTSTTVLASRSGPSSSSCQEGILVGVRLRLGFCGKARLKTERWSQHLLVKDFTRFSAIKWDSNIARNSV